MDMRTVSVTLPCADGTDAACEGPKTYYLPYLGLTDDQIEQVVEEDGSTRIGLSAEQVEANELVLSSFEKGQPLEEGLLMVDINFDTTCGACGSDRG